MTFKLAVKPSAFENILFVDGVSRSGKKLTCRIVSNLERVEYFLFRPMIEQVCQLNKMAMIPETLAIPLLRTLVDETIYSRTIGRDLNTRLSDETSILKAFDSEDYLRRATLNDGQEAVDLFNAQKRVATFHVQHLLPMSDLVFDIFPEAKLIHVMRHPVDLAEAWRKRGWGRRFGEDPLAFSLLVETGSGPVPWFARDWVDHYLEMSETERCIESILSLQQENNKGFQALTSDRKEKIFRFPLERLLSEPLKVIDELAAFVGTEPHPTMSSLLAEQNCPCDLPLEKRRENLRKLEQGSSPEFMEKLLKTASEYESLWNFEAFNN